MMGTYNIIGSQLSYGNCQVEHVHVQASRDSLVSQHIGLWYNRFMITPSM